MTEPQSDAVLRFAELPWQDVAAGCRAKEFSRDGRVLRLVEFDPQFEEEGWCERGHVGFVIEGALDIQFDDRTVRAEPGSGIWIPSGAPHRHRATVISGPVRLVLWEDRNKEVNIPTK